MTRNAPVLVRLVLTFLVVFGTYNPTGISLGGWFAVTRNTGFHSPMYTDPFFYGQILCFFVLFSLWRIFIGIALASLKGVGLFLMVCVVAAAYGLLWSLNVVGSHDTNGWIWAVEIAAWVILFVGSSAPQIYRWTMSVFTNQPIHHETNHHV